MLHSSAIRKPIGRVAWTDAGSRNFPEIFFFRYVYLKSSSHSPLGCPSDFHFENAGAHSSSCLRMQDDLPHSLKPHAPHGGTDDAGARQITQLLPGVPNSLGPAATEKSARTNSPAEMSLVATTHRPTEGLTTTVYGRQSPSRRCSDA